MTSHQSRRDEVEEILALVPGATAAEADALVALFSAAAGPALTGEQRGEAAALAAFQAARPVAGPSRTARFRATALTVKAAVAALAITSVGGVALAATTDVLPAPLTIGSQSSGPAEGKTGDSEAPVARTADPAAVRDAAKTAAAADRADAKAGREKSASYNGLCKAFTAGAWDNARAAGNPAFSRLVAAAPQGDVAAFCTALATEDATAPKADKARTPPGAEKSADKGKAADARDQAAAKSKAAEAKAANKGKTEATAKNPKTTQPRGTGNADDVQRDQRVK